MHPHEPRSAGSGAVGRTSITSVPPAAGSRERTDSPPDPPAAVELETSVEVRRGIGDLAAEIDRLADGPFVRPGWFEVWLRAFGSGDRTERVALRRDSELAAAIVLLRRRGTLASPTNWHTPAFGPVAADPEAEREVARALVDRAPSVLDLSFLDPASAFAGELQAAARDAGRLLIVRPVLRSPYVPLEGSFESYEAGLSSKFRRETRRRRRKLDDLGEVTIAFADGRERRGELLDEGFAVEGSGWKERKGTAIASSPQTDAFYRDVAAWAAADGALELGFLRLGGRCIAFLLSIVGGGEVHVVKVGFDPELRRYAPGTLLTRAAIERAFERGMARYDFLGADDAYKLDWTDAVRERVRIQAFGRTPYGLAAYSAWHWGRPAAKRALPARERRREGGDSE